MLKQLYTGIVDPTNYPLGRKIGEDIPTIMALIDKFKTIEKYKGKNINLYCMGSSGAIMAAIFAVHVPNCEIIHFKKVGEDSHHSDKDHKPCTKNQINIIIDDFIVTGETVNKIASKMSSIFNAQVDCLIVSGCCVSEVLDFQVHDHIISGR